jgi:hypothetical protein
MHFRTIAAVVFACASVVASLERAERPTELIVERVYVPENCGVTTENGHMLSMHYVRSTA